ncbi:MAG: antibiotic biosynthesis monooxygenase [Dehalococcoidales bacterium]|nr:antibiotic biosynthesis monooxygenase [Dehalococcoidales bacterium]
MIKVLLERQVKRADFPKILEHLQDLRAAALYQPGYVFGETLLKGDDPVEVLVISTWASEEHWNAWLTSEERIELESANSHLLLDETKISVYKILAAET